MKIVTLTLNPALDKTIYLTVPFVTGKLNRTERSVLHAGGKGTNVSNVLKKLGVDTLAIAFCGGKNGDVMKSMLDEKGINTALVKTAAETRMNIKIIDGEGVCTEANEKGGPITAEEFEEMKVIIRQSTADAQYFVMCGSIPQGVDKAVYNFLIKELKTSGIRTVLDCDGEALRQGVESSPFIIKPNVFELSQYFATEISTKEKAVELCRLLNVEKGINVICTLGENGSVYAGSEGLYTATSPQVTVRGFSGAGDTFLGAFLAMYDKLGPAEALRFASSTAAAKVETAGTGIPERSEMDKYMKDIAITQIV